MNERILSPQLLKLVQEAGPGYSLADPKWVKKFAESIVKECANHCDLLLDHKISSEWSRGTHDCSKAIKQHFGVEE
jgi:hypothetical protein